MCEMLENEPDENEIPISKEDLLLETLEAFNLYYFLPDKYNSYTGQYLGKDLSAISSIFECFGYDDYYDRYILLTLIKTIEHEDIKNSAQKIEQQRRLDKAKYGSKSR